MACRCFSLSGKPLYNRGALGALPKSVGFGAAPVASKPPAPVVKAPVAKATTPAVKAAAVVVAKPAVKVSATVANNIVAAASAVKAGATPSTAQAINIIKTIVPPVAFKQNLTPPAKSGNTYKALGTLRSPAYGTYRLGALGVSSNVQDFQAGTVVGATIGNVVPGVGTAIGAAVGALVGLVAGLFGKKKSVPKVSPADVQQAQAWMSAYVQVAGSVVGRNFSSSQISDMLTAMAILDPGFWGDAQSTQIPIAAVNNWQGEEMTRLNDFFTAMSKTPLGQSVTMTDDSSIPGHTKTNLNVTFTFTNPGVNAPSYVLGPIFAQYFFAMCTIFQPTGNCTGHLTAPLPQMHTDILDWFRASRPSWDTPQPDVVTETDASIAAPSASVTSTSSGTRTSYVQPAVTATPVAASLPEYSAPAAGNVDLATIPGAEALTPLDSSYAVSAASGAGDSGYDSASGTTGVSILPGLSNTDLLVLALVGAFLLLGRK
jgi:CO/xanthine dehydrogenase FAD-binding subunit